MLMPSWSGVVGAAGRGRPWVLAVLLAAAAVLNCGLAAADGAPPEPLSAFPQSLLAIRTAGGRVINFKIWNADRPSRQEQGLMFVRDMDEHAGMLFVFAQSKPIFMWMKNTYLSLDMLFIDDRGRIATIVTRATPMSEDIISAPAPARAVLELKGGVSERLGIQAGDTVVHRAFGNAK
jgi:uncharacterized membrane protein (UPF0127 family)